MKKNFIILLTSLLFLSGCTGDRCIDPDDFGFIKFSVSSRYDESELTSRQEGDQSAPWRDSGYKVNGYPLTVVVRPWDYMEGDKNSAQELSAWCPWYGQSDNTATLSEFCVRLKLCQFTDGNMCPLTNPKDAPIYNAPCLMKNGVGAYFLIADKNTNPNASPDSQRAPKGITKHLGEPVSNSGYTFYSINKKGQFVQSGGINYQYDGVTASDYAQSMLYFKILDKFYDDNAGQYRGVIKSGVSDTRPDPLEWLTDLIKKELFGTSDEDPGIVRQTYKNIINTPGYRVSVSALLTLYIMFTGFSFLIGNLNLTHVELIVRILKVSIVSILLSSSTAWTFFHDYLFVYFVEGVDQILQIIKEASATGPGSQSLIGLLIAPQTLSKLFSLLFVDPLGFVYIILYLIALYFIFMLIFKATIIYLTALITIGMIITMAPIFICFVLFNITRSLFENWLRQLISYAIQPIILFVGIAFISMIIRTEIYSTLGFGVCKYDFPNLGALNDIFGDFTEDLDISIGDSIFYWWFPTPMKGGVDNFHKADILVPVDYTQDDGTLCTAYECIDNRYIELPFLDLVKDARRISNFINGKFVQLDGLLLIFVSIYLLSKFNDTAISTAKFLSGTSGNLTSLQKVGQQAYDPIKAQIDRPINHAVAKASMPLNLLTRSISTAAATKYEGVMKGRLAEKALSSSANKAVQNEVKMKYGMDHAKLKEGAAGKYKKALGDLMGNEALKGKFTNEEMKKLSEMDYKGMRNKIAEKQFEGKDYKSLTKDQKDEINALLKPRDGATSLRELASDADYAKAYQKAYVEAHQAMSQRGVGLIGKNFGLFRSWKEMNYRIDQKRELDQAEKFARGEKIYAGYEGIKRGALKAVLGQKFIDAYEGNLTGAAWHDFDYNDPRLRTYNEQLKDKAKDREFTKLQSAIDRESVKAGKDISSPEHLAHLEKQGRAADAQHYKDLANQKIAHEVRHKLSEGKDPVLMGERFMKGADESQMRQMVDNAVTKHGELINNDPYLKREEHHKIERNKAKDEIIKTHDDLKKYFNRDDINAAEIPALIEQKAREQKVDNKKIAEEINNFKANVKTFEDSSGVLKQMGDRKQAITDEVNKQINEINKYRKKDDVEQHIKNIENEPRRLKTIDNYLRGK